MSLSSTLKSWWGQGYGKEWSAPGLTAYNSDASSILKPGYSTQLQAVVRNVAPLSLARYIDTYSLGAGFNASDAISDDGTRDAAAGTVVASAQKGPHTVTTNFKFLDPAKAYGSGSIAVNSELRSALGLSPFLYPWLGDAVRLRASLKCDDLDMTKASATKAHTFTLGLNFSHRNVQHGHSFGLASTSKPNSTDYSLYNNISVGSEGAAVGAEVETSTALELRDYNVGAMYARPGAFTISIGTRERLKKLDFSEAFNLGAGWRVASKITTATDFPLEPVCLETGFEYTVPKTTSNSVVKAKVNQSGKISVAVVNNDLPWVNVGVSASANLDSATRSHQGTGLGLSLTFGDNNKLGAADLEGELQTPSAGGAVCFPDGTCRRCPVRH